MRGILGRNHTKSVDKSFTVDASDPTSLDIDSEHINGIRRMLEQLTKACTRFRAAGVLYIGTRLRPANVEDRQ